MTFYNVKCICVCLYIYGYATSSSDEHTSPNLVGILPLISLELKDAQNKADHVWYLMVQSALKISR